ncbi:MAG: alpha/beta fold hydrolase [Xanthomonadales bacterium]|nr:alpha/beta fold hydrolase [Xanthomonadales bacterium]
MKRILSVIGVMLVLSLLVMFVMAFNTAPAMQPWHTEILTEEFTEDMVGHQVNNFNDYLALEESLFKQLDKQFYANSATGPAHVLERYSPGSAADPRRWQTNWNRSFQLTSTQAVGGVLLLHGMSDSPYSLRSLGAILNNRGYHVIGLRLPGHGTAPSGLKQVNWQDMAAATKLAIEHLGYGLGSRPIHIIGYSIGASLALDYTLNALEDESTVTPASLVLISPAIRVHPTAALAGFKNSLSVLPGLSGLAYLSVMAEFDPYKYNSFATNAGAQVHRITRNVDQRLQILVQDPSAVEKLPPILVFKSTVDSTVTTDAVVDNLLGLLPADRNELVLFDINRNAAIKSTLLVSDPGPLTRRLMSDPVLPFAMTLITNENPYSTRVVAQHKVQYSLQSESVENLEISWPSDVVSLSHIALPFPPDDPLYGRFQPQDDDLIYLGNLAFKGEQGLLKLPPQWLLRMRYNPFYTYLQERTVQWFEQKD